MFTPNTLDFLAENRFQNSRIWYAEHKEEFREYVLRPMIETVEYLTPTFEQIDPLIVTEPKVDKTISRVYRDMRRARGEFYREVMWLTFKRDKHMFPLYPEFFLVFSPREFYYGFGCYGATREMMEALRKMIAENHPLFRKADRAYRAQSALTLDGEKYKRSRWPNASPRQKEWLDRKTIALVHAGDPWAELFDPDLPEKMAQAFFSVKAVYDLFILAEQTANELAVY